MGYIMEKQSPHSFFSANRIGFISADASTLRMMELQIKAHSDIHLSEDWVIESIRRTVYSLPVAERPRIMNSACFRCQACLQVEGKHLQPLIDIYIFLWLCYPMRAIASSFLRFLGHTQRRTTVGRTPLDEWSARRRDLYLTTHNTHNKHPCPRWDSKPRSQ